MSEAPGRILYVQYYNPAAYPPLEHSSRILAEAGWSVRFLGIRLGEVQALRFPAHPRIEVRQMAEAAPGWRQKLHYFGFCLRVLATVAWWRPRWLYASDVMAAPVALVARSVLRQRVVYHEHDTPSPSRPPGVFLRLCLAARRRLGRTAEALVLPNAERAEHVARETGREGPAVVVWNCPLVEEVRPAREPIGDGAIRILYHGSIVPDRLPLSVIRAMASSERAELVIAGYQPAGAEGYVEKMRAEAARLGIESRFHHVGPVAQRSDLLDLCATCDVGLALMPLRSEDFNQRTMSGASNKAFDYLACGLALVVSDLRDWTELFVEPGYGLACDPHDEGSIAEALRWYASNPAEARRMGEAGRRRIATDWNYEAQFARVFGMIGSAAAPLPALPTAAEASGAR